MTTVLETETEKTYYVYALNSTVNALVTERLGSKFPFEVRDGQDGPAAQARRADRSGCARFRAHRNRRELGLMPRTMTPQTTVHGSDADGSECGESVITGYKIEISEDRHLRMECSRSRAE